MRRAHARARDILDTRRILGAAIRCYRSRTLYRSAPGTGTLDMLYILFKGGTCWWMVLALNFYDVDRFKPTREQLSAVFRGGSIQCIVDVDCSGESDDGAMIYLHCRHFC